MPKISVIVAVYNVEGYIERCATSLLGQTLDDIEYIFIDDCSPDNSIEILKRTIERFPDRAGSVRIEKMASNSHQAAVRRYGIQLATGDFVIHCDSDDWVDENLYEMLYNEAIRCNADIVLCPIIDEYPRSSIKRNRPVLPSDCKSVVSNWYRNSIGMFSVNKLVKRSIYTENNVLPFEGIDMWEDNGLMLRLMYYSHSLSQIDSACYHYNHTNVNAMTAGYGRSAVDQMIRCAELLEEFFKGKPDYDNFKDTVSCLKYLAKLNLVTDRFDGYFEFKRLFPDSDYIVNEISLSAFSKKGKIRFLMVKYKMGWLFVLLFKAMNGLRHSRR